MSLLTLRNIPRNFGIIQALYDVNIEIDAGEVVGLMGDNGAGKSTLVKIIADNFPPSSGSISVDGQDVQFLKPVDARDAGIPVMTWDADLPETDNGIRDTLGGFSGTTPPGNTLAGENGWTEIAGCPLITDDDGNKVVQGMDEGSLTVIVADTLPMQMQQLMDGPSKGQVGQRPFEMGYRAMFVLRDLGEASLSMIRSIRASMSASRGTPIPASYSKLPSMTREVAVLPPLSCSRMSP